MAKTKPDHDHDPHDNDNDAATDVATMPTGGALAALTALGTVLNNVDTSAVTGRSGKPMLAFKREGNGTWQFGQKATVVEANSRWAINPASFRRGYVAFDSATKKVLGERLLPVSQPMPDFASLPDVGAKWQEEWTVDMRCLDGTDAGIEVVYKPTTVGGLQAIAGLIEAVRDRLNGGQHEGKVSPIALLEKDSYPHVQHGKVWTPVLTIVDWMLMSGPAPAPKPASPPPSTEQPRRRRVG